MSGAEQADDDRLTLGLRWVEGQIDRAALRTTLTYRVLPTLSLGLEYNPLDTDLNVLANWLVVEEGPERPALMLGTSSDRIGTPKGQSYFATLSKNVEPWVRIPIAPYVGAAYGTYDDELRLIGGANLRLTDEIGALVIYDGVHVHPTVNWTKGRHVLGFLLIEGEHPGLSYSISLDVPERPAPAPREPRAPVLRPRWASSR